VDVPETAPLPRFPPFVQIPNFTTPLIFERICALPSRVWRLLPMRRLTTEWYDGVDPNLEMRDQRIGWNSECKSKLVPYLAATVETALDAGHSGRTHPGR
jgi:hypothetical protein